MAFEAIRPRRGLPRSMPARFRMVTHSGLERFMKDTNDKELELFRQYRRIVPDGHGDGRIIPTHFAMPTIYHDDRPAITRTYAGV